MFTDTDFTGVPQTNILRRRSAGKAAWKRVIDTLIASEKEDIKDLAILRRKVNDPDLLKIIAEMNERKSIRIIELTQLLHYRSGDSLD